MLRSGAVGSILFNFKAAVRRRWPLQNQYSTNTSLATLNPSPWILMKRKMLAQLLSYIMQMQNIRLNIMAHKGTGGRSIQILYIEVPCVRFSEILPPC